MGTRSFVEEMQIVKLSFVVRFLLGILILPFVCKDSGKCITVALKSYSWQACVSLSGEAT